LQKGKREGEEIMYDSPLDYCAVCRIYVALDRLQAECALKYRCGRTKETCPLARYLPDTESSIENAAIPSGSSAFGRSTAAR